MVRLIPEISTPTASADTVTASRVAVSAPPTPAKNEPPSMVSLSVVPPLNGPLAITTLVSENVPAATTKPLPMSTPSVPLIEKSSESNVTGVVPTMIVGENLVQSSAAASMFAPVGW